MKTARDYMLEAFGPEWSGKVWDMDRLKVKVERAITEAVEAEREACAEIVQNHKSKARGYYLMEMCQNLTFEIRARSQAKGDGK